MTNDVFHLEKQFFKKQLYFVVKPAKQNDVSEVEALISNCMNT